MNMFRQIGLACSLVLVVSACGSVTSQIPDVQAVGTSARTADDMSDTQAQTMLSAQSLRTLPLASQTTSVTYQFSGTVNQGPAKGTVLEGPLNLTLRALPGGQQILQGSLGDTTPVVGVLFSDNSSILIFGSGRDLIIGRGRPSTLNKLTGVFFGPDISSGNRGTWTATLQSRSAQSGARALHASADTPPVDLFIDGKKVSPEGGFPFRTTFPTNTAGGGYTSLGAGTRAVKVCAAGTHVCPVDASLNLATNVRYTVAVIGTLSPDDDGGHTPRPITPLVLTDSAPSLSNKVQVRLIHAAANPVANFVDVYVTTPGAPLDNPTIVNLKYSTNTGYLPLAPGIYQIRITLPGTKTVVIDSGALSLAPGKVFSAFAVDPLPGNSAFGAVVLMDN